MTPTNEAGHGLLELPALPSLECGPHTGHLAIHTEDQIRRYAEDYGRACYALALSRGLPAITVAMWEAGRAAYAAWIFRTYQQGLPSDDGRGEAAREAIAAMLAAAPAAAGAQGEVPNVADVLLKTDDPIQQMRMVVQVARENDSLISRKWVEGWADQWERERRLTTPQPAAADGGVRERARELLAREVDADAAATPGLSIEAERIRNGKTDSAFVDAALRAVSAALSSHRQAGEDCREVMCSSCGKPTMHLGPLCFSCTKARSAARSGGGG